MYSYAPAKASPAWMVSRISQPGWVWELSLFWLNFHQNLTIFVEIATLQWKSLESESLWLAGKTQGTESFPEVSEKWQSMMLHGYMQLRYLHKLETLATYYAKSPAVVAAQCECGIGQQWGLDKNVWKKWRSRASEHSFTNGVSMGI